MNIIEKLSYLTFLFDTSIRKTVDDVQDSGSKNL